MERSLDKYERAVTLEREAQSRPGWLHRGTAANRHWRRCCLLVDGRWAQFTAAHNKHKSNPCRLCSKSRQDHEEQERTVYGSTHRYIE